MAVVFAGLPPEWEWEGFDRDRLELPAAHNRLIEAVCAVQPHTVVYLANGSPVTMPWLDQAEAVIEGWLGGQAAGGAAADLLFGLVNPSGKLAETLPRRLEDTPAYLNFPGEADSVRYGEGLFVGYRYYDRKKIAPLFPSASVFIHYLRIQRSAVRPESAPNRISYRYGEGKTAEKGGRKCAALPARRVVDPDPPGEGAEGFCQGGACPGETKIVEFTLTGAISPL